MIRALTLVLSILLSCSASADSFRCKGGLVKVGDSVNMLAKKCGNPARKYSTYETINNHGRRSEASVKNWVYERTGQKDMIVSVRNGLVIKVKPD